MDDNNLKTPIAFIIFNRPETTKIVFETIREAKPKKLFVIADGPRTNKIGEKERCLEARAITENIDWNCEVFRNYAPQNLGCRKRVSSGIDWVFENVEEAIFLEDDCLPHPSFFRFCSDLLGKYKYEEKIMLISGNNVLPNYNYEKSSYYFSDYAHIWGWATWRRVWNNYDVDMKDWNKNNNKDLLLKHVSKSSSVKYWHTILNEVYNGVIDTWDYQLQYYIWKQNGLTITPAHNLVINMGFGFHATNTSGSGGYHSKMKLYPMTFPIIHPTSISVNSEADIIENKLYHKFGFKEKIRRLLLKLGINV